MNKPQPKIETKSVLNLMDMCDWIDEKYGIEQRDYAGKHSGPRWPDIVAAEGIAPARAEELYRTAPNAVTNAVEIAAMAKARAEVKEWMDSHPYQDFWHYQLEHFDNFSNDSYQTFNLPYLLEGAKEDWQREIAQMWVDEYSEYADEDGNIFVWVSW